MSNPAEVCRQNKVKSPVWTVCGLSQFRTSRVISTRPRPRVEIERISTACRIASFTEVEMGVTSGTFCEFWRWGVRAPAVHPSRGQNAADHPHHSDHSDRRRHSILALQHGLGLLSGRRTRNNPHHRPHPGVTWLRLEHRNLATSRASDVHLNPYP